MIPRKHGKLKSYSLKATFSRKKRKEVKAIPINTSGKVDESTPVSSSSFETNSGNSTDAFETYDSSYQRRKIAEDVNWDALTFICNAEFKPERQCIWCLVKPATVRCLEYSQHGYCCDDCTTLLHTKINYFHLVEKWEVLYLYIYITTCISRQYIISRLCVFLLKKVVLII